MLGLQSCHQRRRTWKQVSRGGIGATVAHVLVSRYAVHLPLYPQAQILARQGIGIGREVLADWTGTAASEVMPLVRRMREILLASARLFASGDDGGARCAAVASLVETRKLNGVNPQAPSPTC